MDDIRVGRLLRALRRRRGWTQRALGKRAGVSQQAISLVQRGHGASLSGRTMRRIFAALDARWEPTVSWRGGALDRLLDEDHSHLVEATVARLRARGWSVDVEVTYSSYGERGSIDVLAARPMLRAVVLIEVKSELTSIEATLRKMDEKSRLVRRVLCHERYGFEPLAVGSLLVLPSTDTSRRRLRASAIVLDAGLPARGRAVQRWLGEPHGGLHGVWLLADTNRGGATPTRGGPSRVRRPRSTLTATPLRSSGA
jgi:transcriptional regulator with XRE-family HTH domain